MPDEIKRLVLADDHHLLRRGFRSLLSDEPGLEVVGEASTGLEAIEICRRLAPDLVLMDVRMPEMDGITATRQIKREQPGVSVLMVTVHENPQTSGLGSHPGGRSRYRVRNHFSRDKAVTLFLKIGLQFHMPGGICKIGHTAYAPKTSATV